MHFYPRSPCGERPSPMQNYIQCCVFLSTLSLRRATQKWFSDFIKKQISIHALLAESDQRACVVAHGVNNFYPRSPCGERRTSLLQFNDTSKFLSTLSLRRATASRADITSAARYFYPRSPCGERRTHRGNLLWT